MKNARYNYFLGADLNDVSQKSDFRTNSQKGLWTFFLQIRRNVFMEFVKKNQRNVKKYNLPYFIGAQSHFKFF